MQVSVANSIVSQLSTVIFIDNQKEWYTTSEDISVVTANVNPFSAGVVNFSWWYSGIINIDYGQEIVINTSNYGLGNHNFKLISSDILGNTEIIYFSILVYLEVSIENSPYYYASATAPKFNCRDPTRRCLAHRFRRLQHRWK